MTNLELEKCFESFDESISSLEKAYQKVWRQLDELKPQSAVPKDFLEEMAGNLAHEIRNPLGGIANFVALLSDDQRGEKSKSVQGILDGIERIDKVVENLTVFSKPVVLHRISCDFADIIKSAASISKQELGPEATKFEFVMRLPNRQVFVKVDPELMLKALRNILQNSAENMPDGGRIRISLAGPGKSDVLKVTICDDGKGLLNGNAEKPFYPFYTTKTYGMGLGLSAARLILQEHGGEIFLENNRSRGVTATILCPISDQ